MIVLSEAVGLLTIVAFGGAIEALLADRPKIKVADKQLDLFEWISNDRAVERAVADRFGHERIATRVARLLASPASVTIALLGPVGAGKTSISNLVQEKLEDLIPETRIVRLSLWPYVSLESALHAVLAQVLDVVGSEVGTVGFRGVPARYIDAVEGANQTIARLIRAGGKEDPKKLFCELTLLAHALNLRIALWVEDFERFVGFTSNKDATEVNRVAPLRALLNDLSELGWISVVLASPAAGHRFDIEKLARYVVAIPPPSADWVWRTIREFRERAMQLAPVIDPATRHQRRELWPEERSADDLTVLLLGSQLDKLPAALADLCSTPRLLKQVLRSCDEAWRKLPGEFDLDELLAISAIHTIAPDWYEAINRHIHLLRDGVIGPGSKEPGSAFARTIRELATQLSPHRAERLLQLLTLLFPGWEKGRAAHESNQRPQSFAAIHADYWIRYVSLEADTPSDQYILRTIHEWMATNDDRLVREILTGQRARSAEAFFRNVSSKQHSIDLLRASVRHYIGTREQAFEQMDPPAVVSAWRIILRKRPDEGELQAAIVDLVTEALMANNLAIGFSLVHFFGTQSEPSVMSLSAQASKQVAEHFRREFMRRFTGQARLLVEALRGTNRYLLSWSCWGLERLRKNRTTGKPSPSWEKFAPTILEALLIDPSTMMPQLAGLIVKEETERFFDYEQDAHTRQTTQRVDSNSVRELFGRNRFERYWKKLRADYPSLGSDHDEALIEAIDRELRRSAP